MTAKERRQYISLLLVFSAFTAAVIIYGLDKREKREAERAARAVYPVPATVPPTGHLVYGPDAEEIIGYVGPAQVYDGDTLRVLGIRLRLTLPDKDHSLDAPEVDHLCGHDSNRWACGIAARDALVRLVRDGDVTCWEVGKHPAWGRRPLVICHKAAGENINAAMVRLGWAVEFRYLDGYQPVRGEPARAMRGIWAGPFDWPWVWREVPETQRP